MCHLPEHDAFTPAQRNLAASLLNLLDMYDGVYTGHLKPERVGEGMDRPAALDRLTCDIREAYTLLADMDTANRIAAAAAALPVDVVTIGIGAIVEDAAGGGAA